MPSEAFENKGNDSKRNSKIEDGEAGINLGQKNPAKHRGPLPPIQPQLKKDPKTQGKKLNLDKSNNKDAPSTILNATNPSFISSSSGIDKDFVKKTNESLQLEKHD